MTTRKETYGTKQTNQHFSDSNGRSLFCTSIISMVASRWHQQRQKCDVNYCRCPFWNPGDWWSFTKAHLNLFSSNFLLGMSAFTIKLGCWNILVSSFISSGFQNKVISARRKKVLKTPLKLKNSPSQFSSELLRCGGNFLLFCCVSVTQPDSFSKMASPSSVARQPSARMMR